MLFIQGSQRQNLERVGSVYTSKLCLRYFLCVCSFPSVTLFHYQISFVSVRMKWNTNNIIDFLKLYEQHPVLWNIRHKDYCNTKLKEELFQQLKEQLAAKGLIEGMDDKQLKSKIKTIKDVYRHELAKIEKSRKSGAGTEEVYSPKLVWFSAAHFFREVLSTRKTQSNLVSKFIFYCTIHAMVNNMHMFQKCFNTFIAKIDNSRSNVSIAFFQSRRETCTAASVHLVDIIFIPWRYN